MGKYDVAYYKCNNCGLLETEKPYWLSEAYANTIPKTDEGLLRRNLYFADKVEKVIRKYFDARKDYLDYGGGYGFFTRLMRDRGLRFWHADLFCQNLFGFDVEEGRQYELITAIEVFEHFENPLLELRELIKRYSPTSILFSTAMQPQDPKNWWYLSPEEGQHVAFLSPKTLAYIAQELGMNYHTEGGEFSSTNKQEITQTSQRFDCLRTASASG